MPLPYHAIAVYIFAVVHGDQTQGREDILDHLPIPEEREMIN